MFGLQKNQRYFALAFGIMAAPALVEAATLIEDFEDEDLAGWTVTGTAWENGPNNGYTGPNQFPPPTPLGNEGSRWADSWPDDGNGNDGLTGTLTSPKFVLDENTLRFKMAGFGGNGQGVGSNLGTSTQMANMNNIWELRRFSDGAVLSQGSGPFSGSLFVEYTVDTSDHIGTEVQLVVTDNATNGFGWIGIDHIRTEDRDATSVFTLEVGDDQGDWVLSGGSSFDYHAVLNFTVDRHAREGGEFLRSQDGGTGIAKSDTFVITRDTLEFYSAGFGNFNNGGVNNTIELRLASDDSILAVFGDDESLGGDSWQAQVLDVTDFELATVYLQLNDTTNGGFGWVGIDDVRLTGTIIPEPTSLVLLGFGGLALLRRC